MIALIVLIALICRFCSQWNPADAARCRFCDNPREASEDLTASGQPPAQQVEIGHLIGAARDDPTRDGAPGVSPWRRSEVGTSLVIGGLVLGWILLRLACGLH